MKLRTFLILFVLAFVGLTSMNRYVSKTLIELNDEWAYSLDEMLNIEHVAVDVLDTNQHLTRFARAYVSTGNPKKREFYDRILDILAGKVAAPPNYSDSYWNLVAGGLTPFPEKKTKGAQSIEDVFLKLNISTAEFNKLKEAMARLLELSQVENRAMDIAKEYYTTHPADASGMTQITELRHAFDLLHNEDYLRKDGEVSRLLDRFHSMIEERISARMDTINDRYDDLVLLSSRLTVAMYMMMFVSSLYLLFWVHKRGVAVVSVLQRISDGELSARTTITSRDEVGKLGRLVNWTGSNLESKVSELEDKIAKTELLMEELTKERDRSQNLLHSILPIPIAERISRGEARIAEVFPEVTVLFADIVGFTQLSERLGPAETVSLLSVVFEKFDELAEKHNVEKIKTVGDCYMVVAGVPTRDPLHCQHMAEFALEALHYFKEMSESSLYNLKLRIGMHTGTVAAGVVGKKKLSYDLWGDVVNVASRFESSGESNGIHVSEAVRFRLADDFLFSNSGEVNLKGKGSMRSFYLLGRKDGSRASSQG
jgi:class 3 adenylate cyclase/HAMP domain-containing protein